MLDTLIHRWLRIPYALRYSVTRPRAGESRGTVLLIHGIGNSGAAWNKVVERLPADMTYVTIDLLGFGSSPRPHWALYDAKTQARSVMATLLKLRITGKVTLVGHSLGALVAVEVAKRYPLFVSSLVLCSPPFYSSNPSRKLLPPTDRMLQNLYRSIQRHPERFLRLSRLAKQYGLVNEAYSLTTDDLASYMGALEASIVNQTSLEDAKQVNRPLEIIYGTLDPVVIKRNLKEVVKSNPNAVLKTIVAGHEVKGPAYVKAVTAAVARAVTQER